MGKKNKKDDEEPKQGGKKDAGKKDAGKKDGKHRYSSFQHWHLVVVNTVHTARAPLDRASRVLLFGTPNS